MELDGILPCSQEPAIMSYTRYFLWNVLKVNVKLSPCLTKHHAMKAYWGSGGTAPRIPPRH
jgi:hypothetical protein